jgi:hypothetical protein
MLLSPKREKRSQRKKMAASHASFAQILLTGRPHTHTQPMTAHKHAHTHTRTSWHYTSVLGSCVEKDQPAPHTLYGGTK